MVQFNEALLEQAFVELFKGQGIRLCSRGKYRPRHPRNYLLTQEIKLNRLWHYQ